MRNTKVGVGLVMLMAIGCGSVVDNPYESCNPGDSCTNGLTCLSSTLPVSAGYSGSLCTQSCGDSSDCLQDVSSYSSVCVNTQCYISCTGPGSACPYGTACLTFADQTGSTINICTP